MTSQQIEVIIKQMKSKSCELDKIPTHVLKDMLPVVLPIITQMVNLSLSHGVFSESWRTAIVHLLLIGLDLIKANLDPWVTWAFYQN